MALHLHNPDPEALPPRTHNAPPEPISASLTLTAEEWAEHMAHVFEQPMVRKAELLGAVQRFEAAYDIRKATTPGAPPIGIDKWDDDVAGRAGDLRDKLNAVIKQANDLHSLEKAPILASGRCVDGFKNNFLTDLTRGVDLIRGRLTVYLTHIENEKRRKAQEEAEALRRHAEEIAATAAQTMKPEALDQAAEAFGQAAEAEAVASAPAADLSRTYGAMGSVSSLRTTWKFFPEESNLLELVKAVAEGKAPIEYLTFNEKRLNFAVKSEKLRAAPGCAIRQEIKA